MHIKGLRISLLSCSEHLRLSFKNKHLLSAGLNWNAPGLQHQLPSPLGPHLVYSHPWVLIQTFPSLSLYSWTAICLMTKTSSSCERFSCSISWRIITEKCCINITISSQSYAYFLVNSSADY